MALQQEGSFSWKEMANLLGYALLVNSITLYLAKRRGGTSPDSEELVLAAVAKLSAV